MAANGGAKPVIIGGVSARMKPPPAAPPDLQARPSATAHRDPGFKYQGGPIIAAPQVHTSFWGSTWTDAHHAQRRVNLIQFMKDFLASDYMNILSQCGVGQGAGRCGTWEGDSSLPTVSGQLSDNDIRAHIQSLIDAGTLPEPGSPSSVALMIFLDESIEINDGGLGVVMCEPQGDSAFGYHYYFTTKAGHRCYYSIVPSLDDACLQASCGQDSGCSLHLAATQEQRQTQVASHEFSEMVTDPEINAWRDATSGDENGDLCNGQSGTITVGGRAWTVQLMYSPADAARGAQACVLAPSKPIPSLLPHHRQGTH